MFKAMRNKLKETKGFTLIELVVVVALIGILSGVAVPKYLGFQEDARQKNDIAIGKQIADITTMSYATEKVTLDALAAGFEVNLDNAGAPLPTDTTPTAAQVVMSYLEANHPSLKSSMALKKYEAGKGKVLYVRMNRANNNAISVYVGNAATDANMIYPTAEFLK